MEPLQKGLAPNPRSLEVEMWPVPLAQARDIGLSEEWVKKFESSNQSKRHVLNIRRVFAQSDASTKLKTGDLILSVNGHVCTTFRDVELATQAEQVEITLFRDKKEVTVTVSTALLNGEGTQKIACWYHFHYFLIILSIQLDCYCNASEKFNTYNSIELLQFQ